MCLCVYVCYSRAVDSQLYQREKEKYLKDCVRESGLLQQERAERKARMDMLLKAQKENKVRTRSWIGGDEEGGGGEIERERGREIERGRDRER